MKKINFSTGKLVAALVMVCITVLAYMHSSLEGVLYANTFLTTAMIARESVMRLRNALVMKALVYNDYSNDFQKQGDSIRVKKPATYTAAEFTSTISAQALVEDSVTIQLNHLADVSIALTAKEEAMNIDNFADQLITPAMQAIAQKIDVDILTESYKGIPYFAGTSGTTPDGLDDFAAAAKVLNLNKAPQDLRRAVWSPTSQAAFSVIPSLINAEKSGSTDALRNGSIGKVFGLENFMSQNVVTHTPGTYTGVTSPVIKTTGVVAASTLDIKSSTASALTLKQGDLFTVTSATTGIVYNYVVTDASPVTSSGTAATGITVNVYPAVQVAHAVNDVVTFPDCVSTVIKNSVQNLVFHPKAIAFVQRPLVAPASLGPDAYTASFEGISIRVVKGYDLSTKTSTISFDTLYGIKVINPALAVRYLG